MKYRYTKYIEGLLDGLDMDSLVSRLSDLLLSSGFNNPWDPQSEADQSMQALHDAVLDALAAGETPKPGTQEPGRHTSEPAGGPTTLAEMVDANHDYRDSW